MQGESRLCWGRYPPKIAREPRDDGGHSGTEVQNYDIYVCETAVIGMVLCVVHAKLRQRERAVLTARNAVHHGTESVQVLGDLEALRQVQRVCLRRERVVQRYVAGVGL